MKNRKQVHIGSVSTGTLVTDDLISSFMWELKHDESFSRRRYAQLEKELAELEAHEDEDGLDEFLNDTLFDAMQNLAPAYFYFGAHPGDGADFGFWLEEYFEQEFDGLRVADLAEVPKGHSGEVLLVNDHGNMSLYAFSRGRSREIWAIV